MHYLNPVAAGSTTAATDTIVLTVTQGIAAAQLLVLAATGGGTTGRAVSTVTDSKGNTYTLGVNVSAAGNPIAIAQSQITTPLVPGDTITVQYNGSFTRIVAAAHAFAGAYGASPEKVNSAFSTNTSPTVTTSGATANTTELIFAAASLTGASSQTQVDTFVPTAPLVDLGMTATNGTSTTERQLHCMYRVVTTSAVYGASGVNDVSVSWRIGITITPGPDVVGRAHSFAAVIG